MAKGGKEPFAKEAGAARDKEFFPTQLLEFRRGVARDVVQIGAGQREEMVLIFAHSDRERLILFP